MPIIDMVATDKRINELRIQRGISIKDISITLGFSTPQAVYKWIYGRNLPTVDNLVILAHVLGVRIDDILVLINTEVA